MKKKLSILLSAVIFGIGLFAIPQTSAITNICKNADQFQLTFTVSPPNGTITDSVKLTGTFRWLTSNPACLDGALLFDVSAGYKGSSRAISEQKIGVLPQNQLAGYEKNIKVSDLGFGALKPGDVVNFYINIEGDDITDKGDDLLPQPRTQTYTISQTTTTQLLCAYPTGNQSTAWVCVKGSESVADCKTLSVQACQQGLCTKVDPKQCSQDPRLSQTPPPGPTTTVGTTGQDISVNLDIRNPLAISDVNQLISKVQEWLIKFSIPVGVILIIYAGILLIFSRGNSAQITKARQIIQGVALGLAIIFIGSGFVSLVESILELGGPAGTPGPTATLDPEDTTCLCEPGAGVCLSQQCKSGTYCFAIDGVGQCKSPSQDPYEGDDCSVNACPGGYTCSSFKFCHRILP